MNAKNMFTSMLANKAMQMLKDPRVSQLLQNEQVTRAVVGALHMQGEIKAKVDAQVKSVASEVAKRLNLATKSDLYRITNQLERVQRAVDAQKKKDDHSR